MTEANSWGWPDSPFPHSQKTVYERDAEDPKVVLYDHEGKPLTYDKPKKVLGFRPPDEAKT